MHTRLLSDERGYYLSVTDHRGDSFLIDASDEDFLASRKWRVTETWPGLFYVTGYKKGSVLLLHRALMNAPPRKPPVDHRDGNGLNNRRYNLRIATPHQNASNRHHRKRGVSGYRGVYPNGYGRWYALIRFDYKLRHLGTFDDPIAAAKAYDAAAVASRGEFHGQLNFP